MKKIQWGGFGVIVVLLVVVVLSAPLAYADTVQVSVGEAVTIPGENVSKIAIADPTVADVVPLSDKELSVIGKKAGVTTLTIVKSDGSATQLHRVDVSNDAAAAAIRQMVGQTGINVRAVGDTLVLDGRVENELQAQRAAEIASAFKDKVLNLVETEKPRQIRVRTRIAEVNTDAIKNVGLKWFGPQGQVQYAMQYIGGGSIEHGFIPTAAEFGSVGTSVGNNPNEVTLTVLLDLLITKSYARLLSEPTLVTFSGKEASFLVGQQIPIVQQLPNSFTVEFKDVGVRMKIKPTADSENRINTTIHAEVSQVSGASVNGIPIINSKSADTTLQVNDGQTIVIGGLLENNIQRDVLRKMPWLGDIPVIGLLFRDKEFEQAKREILFFMTPEVIKDTQADTAAAVKTPGMGHWMAEWNKGGLVPAPDKKDDWGLHNPDRLGFPHGEKKSTAPAKSAAPAKAAAVQSTPSAKPAAVPKPATSKPSVVKQPVAEKPAAKSPSPAAPPEEPTSNFSAARPAGS
jgi:pilus assembly protein CpaC